jgi:hypothetical protein
LREDRQRRQDDDRDHRADGCSTGQSLHKSSLPELGVIRRL